MFCSWDEWVPESRVLKYNEANVARQKEVQKAHSAQPTKAKKSTKKAVSTKTDSVKDGDSRASTPITEFVRGNLAKFLINGFVNVTKQKPAHASCLLLVLC